MRPLAIEYSSDRLAILRCHIVGVLWLITSDEHLTRLKVEGIIGRLVADNYCPVDLGTGMDGCADAVFKEVDSSMARPLVMSIAGRPGSCLRAAPWKAKTNPCCSMRSIGEADPKTGAGEAEIAIPASL
ncbi:MAG TPA: hypothetical protein VGY56_12595 [Verrucomicrobiae bacterium]|nr:hypothetical protein [Verrucomicrobiae bacterium]